MDVLRNCSYVMIILVFFVSINAKICQKNFVNDIANLQLLFNIAFISSN